MVDFAERQCALRCFDRQVEERDGIIEAAERARTVGDVTFHKGRDGAHVLLELCSARCGELVAHQHIAPEQVVQSLERCSPDAAEDGRPEGSGEEVQIPFENLLEVSFGVIKSPAGWQALTLRGSSNSDVTAS